ncbi:sericin-2-like [Myxocyprinus asiaticus]|uniref:sericin-2-like n=1 Tax=Myxocyprinus asiaticus TaxID=70543 RepID=UPI002223DF28|nr:sericin-2-like [Myxocyprinus asiaticus]
MVVPTERMNELWKRMALVLVFAILLLHSCQAQGSTVTNPPLTGTSAGSTSDPTGASKDINTTAKTNNAAPNAMSVQSTAPQAFTVMMSSPSSSTAGPTSNSQTSAAPSSAITISGSKGSSLAMPVVHSSAPTVAGVEEKTELMTSQSNQVSGAQRNEEKAETKENDSSSSSSSVFVSVLMSGLLLAAIIIGTYYFKCHRQTSSKGMKLAEESLMADEENQGNTLVSVAPLNQLEPQEKPSLNGESTEAVKTQTPPAATNGHSTTKTADTEL